jgi:predicted O-methyltransferase YrrM
MNPNDPHNSCDDGPMPADMADRWRVFLVPPELRVEEDSCPELFEHPTLFPLQRRRELEAMIRMARSISPRVVMEIGADKGAGFFHWLKCLPTVRGAIACEIRGTPYIPLFATAFPGVKLLAVEKSSLLEPTRDEIAAWLGAAKLDVLFIDGNKACVERDYQLYGPMVRPGGLIFIHDVNPSHTRHGVAPAAKFFHDLAAPGGKGLIVDTSELSNVPSAMSQTAYDIWLRFWGLDSCGVGWVIKPGPPAGTDQVE